MKIKCTPELGTVKTNIIQRTIGRAVSIDPATSPFGPASSDLLGDTFHCLYGMEFEPLKNEDAPETRRVNHALMKWLAADDQFTQTREHTSGKLILSMAATKTLYEYLLTDEAIREALKVQEASPQMPSQIPTNADGQESGGEGMDTSSDKLSEAINRLGQLQRNVIGSQIISNAAKKADESAGKTEQVLRSWGIEPGDITIVDVDSIMRLVNGNSQKMNHISELAGRFENVCASALERTRESYIGQIVDVHRTQDFSLMFPPELCYLMSPEVPPLIHVRYVSDYLSHGLLGFELRSEGKEFGSLYVMVDGSGSMNPDHGGFEIQAKAIAIGLARALKKDKLSGKEYKLNIFGSSHDPFLEVTSDEGMTAHYEWAEQFHNGGTDFNHAFEHAITALRDMPNGTDFVFITDGECNLGVDMMRAWKDYKDETNARLLYIDVSGMNNSTLRSISDMYMHVSFDKTGNMDMIAENIAESLATSIERARLAEMDDNQDV